MLPLVVCYASVRLALWHFVAVPAFAAFCVAKIDANQGFNPELLSQ
jgi:hypothetical protein